MFHAICCGRVIRGDNMTLVVDVDGIDHIENCIDTNSMAIYFKVNEQNEIPPCLYVPPDYCVALGTGNCEGKLIITL